MTEIHHDSGAGARGRGNPVDLLVNRSGVTQFRIPFSIKTDGDDTNDHWDIWDETNVDVLKRPLLRIRHYDPCDLPAANPLYGDCTPAP